MPAEVVPLLPRSALAIWYIGDGAFLYLLPSGAYAACDGKTVTAVRQQWAAQQHLVSLMSEMLLTPHAMAAMLGAPNDLVVRWWGGEETLTEDVIRKLQKKSWERAR